MLDGLPLIVVWTGTVVGVVVLWRKARWLRPRLRHVIRGLLCAVLLAPALIHHVPGTQCIPAWFLPIWIAYRRTVDGSEWMKELGIDGAGLIGFDCAVIAIFAVAVLVSRTLTIDSEKP